LHDYVICLLAFSGAARLSVHYGDRSEAHRQLTRAMRGRLSATYVLPFVAARLRLHLAKVYLAIAEQATARQLLREIDDILSHRPALGALIGEVDEFRRKLGVSSRNDAVQRATATGLLGD
jgi:LuxR family maltose regulon positive regulatory protein